MRTKKAQIQCTELFYHSITAFVKHAESWTYGKIYKIYNAFIILKRCVRVSIFNSFNFFQQAPIKLLYKERLVGFSKKTTSLELQLNQYD